MNNKKVKIKKKVTKKKGTKKTKKTNLFKRNYDDLKFLTLINVVIKIKLTSCM